MTDDQSPLPDPRVAGVREHYARMRLFLDLGTSLSDPAAKFRLMMAALYSARAVVELHFEAAIKGQLLATREELKATLPTKLPWFNLIERIRIHDFHRFGVLPPDPRVKMSFQGGPIKLRAKQGTAAYTIGADGPKATVSGDSSIDEQRPLLVHDGKFFDDDTKQYVSLEQIVVDSFAALPNVIAQFEKELLA